VFHEISAGSQQHKQQLEAAGPQQHQQHQQHQPKVSRSSPAAPAPPPAASGSRAAPAATASTGTKSKARPPAPVGYTATSGTKRRLCSPVRQEPRAPLPHQPRGPPPVKAKSAASAAAAAAAPAAAAGAATAAAASSSSSSSSSKPKQQYSELELIEMRAESAVAEQLGLSWKERGPPPSHGPLWRNQEYRTGSERWANRGGAAKDWYTAFYKAKRSMDKPSLDRWLDANPKPGKV
jgi:hypothetical protein